MLSEWQSAIINKGGSIDSTSMGIMGIGTQAVLAIPFMDGLNSVTRNYESRTATNGGILVTRSQTPAEAALHKVLRPNSEVIEVGNNPRRNLVQCILNNDGNLLFDGVPAASLNKLEGIKLEADRRKISRIVSHQQDERVVAIAKELGLRHEENVEVFKIYTTKSGFNTALREYFGGVGAIGPLGTTFKTQADIVREYKRLEKKKVGAIIKFDYSGKGLVMSGTADPLILEVGLDDTTIFNRISTFLAREHIHTLRGEIQMYIPEHVVVSISSGTNENGEIDIYESHIQTQRNGSADGAVPLQNNKTTYELLVEAWPKIADLYKKLGMTGSHNINFLIMPPEAHKIAQSLYGDTLSHIVAIDCNYRPISGTLNAMQRLQEETHMPINQANFISKSIEIPSNLAGNLHVFFHIAAMCGLRPGNQGNFSLIKASGFDQQKRNVKQNPRAHIIINGSTCMNAASALAELKLALQNRELIDMMKKQHGLFPVEALVDKNYYFNHLKNQLLI